MLRLPSYILKSEKPGPVSNKTGRIEEARADVNQNTARSLLVLWWFRYGLLVLWLFRATLVVPCYSMYAQKVSIYTNLSESSRRKCDKI